MRLSAFTLHTTAELEQLEGGWWELWERSPVATPFQSPGWLLPWWNAFSPGEICSVAICNGSKLAALAPFYLEYSGHRRRLLPLGISLSDYHDIIVDPQLAEHAAHLIAAESARLAWDEWELPDLAPRATALDLGTPEKCRVETHRDSCAPVLVLPQADAGIQHALPAAKRRKVRMARHRAGRRGRVTIEQVKASSVQLAFDTLCAMHRKRWAERGEEGVLGDARTQAFHRAALPQLAERGVVRLYTLTIDDVVAGIYYGFLHRDRAYAYIGGFDPAFAFESPGTILIAHAIESAVLEGASEFHFLRGQERYKYEWGAIDRWNARRVFVRSAARAYAS